MKAQLMTRILLPLIIISLLPLLGACEPIIPFRIQNETDMPLQIYQGWQNPGLVGNAPSGGELKFKFGSTYPHYRFTARDENGKLVFITTFTKDDVRGKREYVITITNDDLITR